jgi:hypothetical protein
LGISVDLGRPVRRRSAIAIPGTAIAACRTAFFDLSFQRPARPVQANAYIVGREPEIGRDPLSRLLLEVGASNNLGIVWPECRHEVPNAATWIIGLVCARLNHGRWSLSLIRSLRPLPRSATAVMVGQRIAHNAAEPGVDLAAIVRRLRSPDHL